MLIGKIGMKGVTHFVSQGELAVQSAGIVQKHKGVHIRARGISAAALALVLVYIDPAIVKALFQDPAVVLSQRCQGIENRLLGLLKGNVPVGFRHQRRVNVIEMELVHPQQLLAQPDIAVHGGQLLVNGFNEIFVHGHRHIASVQGSFQGRAIVSGLAEEFQLLVLAVQHRGGGVAHARKSVVEIFVGTFPQDPVGAFFQQHKGTLAQGVLVPLAVCRVRKFQVGIRQSAVGRVRQLCHFPGGSQQLFLLGRQGVGLSPAQIGQIPAITFQLGNVPVEAFQRLIGNGHDLRGVKAARGVQSHHRAHEFSL